MDISEQITKVKDSREAAMAQQTELSEKAAGEDRTFSTAENEQFDTLQTEIDAADQHIERLEKQLTNEQKNAAPVDKGQPGVAHRTPKNTPDISNGIGFAKAARCLALGAIEHRDATQIAESLYGDERVTKAVHGLMTKASVSPATTDNDSWAGNLVNGQPAADFIEYLMPRTIIGNLNMRTVPFRQPIIQQDGIGTAAWVGEGKAKPATSMAFSQKQIEPLKVAALAVASMETLRDSSPSADTLIRDSLVEALQYRLDADFIGPDNAGTANIKPASITNGVTGTAASGKDAAAVRKDVKALFGHYISNNRSVDGAVFVTDPATALAISIMANDQGTPFFPGMGMNGGTLFGLPVVTSSHVPLTSASPDKHALYLVDASNIYYNAGGVEVSMSNEASIEMSDSPKMDGTNPLVSLWQSNMVGFLAEMRVNWAPRRADSVSAITGAQYGE